MFLSLTLDRKEELDQYSNNANLHPGDVSYGDLKKYNDNVDFNPGNLDNSSERNEIKKAFCSFMKEAACASNHNLLRNSNAFISNGGKIDPDFELSWINNSYVKSKQNFNLDIKF